MVFSGEKSTSNNLADGMCATPDMEFHDAASSVVECHGRIDDSATAWDHLDFRAKEFGKFEVSGACHVVDCL